MAGPDSEESEVGLIIEATLPYRWDEETRRIVPTSSAASSSWSVIGGRSPEENWRRLVNSIFAIRQLQQWFSASGRGLQLVQPALRDRVSRRLGR